MWSFWVFKEIHIWPKPMVLGPQPGVWARCGHFGVFEDQTHGSGFGPNPRFWAQNFGPNVLNFECFGSQIFGAVEADILIERMPI